MKNLIVESKTDSVVRKVVRDITNLVKSEKSDQYHLPEDISVDFNIEYEFPQLPFSFDVILDLKFNENAKYYLNSNLMGDDTIGIVLKINPKDMPQLLYDLISDLNDIVAHELEHIFQNYGYRDVNIENYPEYSQLVGKEYYKHPIEVPAQIAGFKRQSKVTRKPIKELIKSYFEKIKDQYDLSDEDVEDIIDYLSSKI